MTPDLETYQYDASGNPRSKTVVMPNVSPAAGWTVQAHYNGQDQIASLTYPALDADAPSVVRGYDRAGRLAAVGTGTGEGPVVDPSNPPPPPEKRWAAYGYDLFGRLAAVRYNNAIDSKDGPALARSYAYDAYQRLAEIADPYFVEALTYDSGTGLGGWSYYDGRIAQAQSGYVASAKWSPVLPSFTQQFQYDGYGRLAAAVNSLGDAFSLAPGGSITYDANGNVRTSARGRTQTRHAFAGSGAAAKNQLLTVTSTVDAHVVFNTLPAGATTANAWTWGSSNGGPSGSSLTKTTEGPIPGTTQVLQLAGGGLGHYETLRLASYLHPGATYTLSWQIKTDPVYGEAIGRAVWYAVLVTESGPSVAVPLKTVAAATGWQSDQQTVDPASLAKTYGRGLPIVAVTIELRNQGRNADGSSGPLVFLTEARVAGSTTGATFSYDGDGSVTAAPDRNLTALAYDPTTRLTTSITLGADGRLALAYGGDQRRSRAVLTRGERQETTVTLTGFDGEVLATKTTGGAGTVSYYLHGPEGALGMLSGGRLRLLLGDHLGSLRLSVDAPSGIPVSAGDYLPSGGAQRRTAASGTDVAFTGQRLDAATGLYNYNARLYDPALGRFYATDPTGELALRRLFLGVFGLNLLLVGIKLVAFRRKQVDDTAKGVPRTAGPRSAVTGCAIDVRLTYFGPSGRFLSVHTFIIYRGETGTEWYFRGGPGNPRCAWARDETLTGRSGLYTNRTIDWDPGASSVTVATGPAVCGKNETLQSELDRISNLCLPYETYEVNCNRFTSTLLNKTRLPVVAPPDAYLPRWLAYLLGQPADHLPGWLLPDL